MARQLLKYLIGFAVDRRGVKLVIAQAMKTSVIELLLLCGPAFLVAHPTHAAQTGSVVAWGNQVLPMIEPGTRYSAVACGGLHNVALKRDGSLVAWGHD